MKSETTTSADLVPPDLIPEIQATAEAEHRAPGELIRDAFNRYKRDEEAWQDLLVYGQERARELGRTEADVPRLTAESRQERRQGH
jgi:hypothetical protein